MNSTDFLGQSWWQGIGVVTSVILGTVAIILTLRQNKQKKLSYKVLYSESLLSIDKKLRSDLEIRYKNFEVEQINVLKIQIINDGRVPIRRDDFDGKSIRIELKNCKNLFSYEITDSMPAHLEILLDSDSNAIVIPPTLINPNDYFTIQTTFDGSGREFSLHARIEGLSEINTIPSYIPNDDLFFDTRSFLKIWITISILYILCALAYFFDLIPEIISSVIALVAILTLLVKTLSERFSEQAKRTLRREE